MGLRENEPVAWLLDIVFIVILATIAVYVLTKWVFSWFGL